MVGLFSGEKGPCFPIKCWASFEHGVEDLLSSDICHELTAIILTYTSWTHQTWGLNFYYTSESFIIHHLFTPYFHPVSPTISNPHTAMPPLIGGLETSRTKDLLLLTSDPLKSMEIVGEVRVSLSFGPLKKNSRWTKDGMMVGWLKIEGFGSWVGN